MKAVIFAVLLASCATEHEFSGGGVFIQRVVGNEVGVTITNVFDEAVALLRANQHCRQFTKVARFGQMRENNASFECFAL